MIDPATAPLAGCGKASASRGGRWRRLCLNGCGELELTANGPQNVADISFTVLFHERNRGKGAGVRTGLACVSGDVVVIQDADLEYDPND